MLQTGKPVFVQTLLKDTSVEGFDVGVLVGLEPIGTAERPVYAPSSAWLGCRHMPLSVPDYFWANPVMSQLLQDALPAVLPNTLGVSAT